MKPSVYPAMLLLLGTAFGASAQNMKPGLWEINNKMGSASGEMEQAMADMQKQMAAMSPEQRKMMQDMLAKQGVGTAAASGPGAISVKVCMTQEMVDRNEVSTSDGDCKSTYAPRVGNTMKVSFVCTKPPSSGDGEVNFVSPVAYTSRMNVNTTVKGKSEKLTVDSQGKWLDAECGAIKPLGSAKK